MFANFTEDTFQGLFNDENVGGRKTFDKNWS